MGLVRMPLSTIAAALAASSAGAQTPAEPLEMTPSSSWVADYAEDSCALIRDFQAGDDKVTLQLRQFGPGDSFDVTIVSKTLARTRQAPRVRFEPDERFFDPPVPFSLENGDMRGVVYTDSLRPVALKTWPRPDWPEAERVARERTITGLSIARTFERDLLLRTGRMDQPMAAMRACLDELLVRWGIDPVQQRALSRQPEPIDLGDWLRRLGHPDGSRPEGGSASYRIRLVVGADGKPSSCIPDADWSGTAFGERICETAMRLARFEPALDADGAPIASLYNEAFVHEAVEYRGTSPPPAR